MNNTLQYVTDNSGEKIAVLMPIAEYEDLMEDLSDLAAIADRRSEPTIKHNDFLEELRQDGILSNCICCVSQSRVRGIHVASSRIY